MLVAGFTESVRPATREGVQRHLGHLLGGPLAGVQAEAGLQARHRHRVRPQRRDGVRVGLQGQYPAQDAGRGLAEAVDQRGVDLAGQDLDVGLVQRPRGVHLDVRLVDRRHGADRVDRRDERKCPAGKVIRGAGAPEADIGLLDARVRRTAWRNTASASRRRWWCRRCGAHAGHARSRRRLHREQSCSDPFTGGACRCRIRRRVRRSAGSSRCCRCRGPTPRGASTPPRTRMPIRTSAASISVTRCRNGMSAPSSST